MSTTHLPSVTTQQLIDQRLDAIDRALLGLLPRGDRQAIVAQVETRLRDLAAADLDVKAHQQAPVECPSPADAAAFGLPGASADAPPGLRPALSAASRRGPRLARSSLALSSGIVGIVALVLLFTMPITYVIASSFSQAEEMAEVLVITHVAAVALGGTMAVVLGISGLVSLSRRAGSLVGHGWAITGLCTGPLPMIVGGLLGLIVGFEIVSVEPVYSVTVDAPTPYVATAPQAVSAPMPSMPLASPPTVSEVPAGPYPPDGAYGAPPTMVEGPAELPVADAPGSILPPPSAPSVVD